MKKFLTVFVCILTIIVSTINPAFAVSKTQVLSAEKFVFTQNQLNTNKDFHKHVASNKVTLDVKDRFISKSGDVLSRQSDYNYDINIDDIENYNDNNLIIKASAADESGTNTKTAQDGSISLRVTLTVKYTITGSKIKMTKITSKLVAYNGSTNSNMGNGVTIQSNTLTYGQIDYSHSSQHKTVTLPAKACNKTFTPTSWAAVSASASYVGAVQNVKLKRAGSQWSLELANHVSSSMPMV